MKKSSDLQEKRVSAIKTLMKNENLKEYQLAEMIPAKGKDPASTMEPQNLSACLCKKRAISDKLCRTIGSLFPKYNVMWLLGDSDLMLVEDIRQDYIKRTQASDNACLLLLESALREVCVREGIDIPELENIPEILLLQGQLRDFADSLMWNYVRHRDHSHFWGTLDQELDAIEKKYQK